MGTIVVAADCDFSRCPRPRRAAQALVADYDVVCAGFEPIDNDLCGFIQLPRRLNMRAPVRNRLRKIDRFRRLCTGACEEVYRDDEYVQSAYRALSNTVADFAWVHDLRLLPVALETPGIAHVGFDAREYYPSQYEDQFLWNASEKRLQQHLVETYIPMADVVTTVSPGLAERYRLACGVTAQVIRSLPEYADIDLDVQRNTQSVRIVYHGKAHENRRIEEIIRLGDLLDDRFSLTLMLVGGRAEYLAKLRTLIDKSDRVALHPPVPFEQIAEFTSAYDIGLCAIPDSTLNLRYCLPNKLFEMIQARLAIVSWPSPDVADVVRSNGVGVVADSFSVESLAHTINELTADQIMKYRRSCCKVAKDLSFNSTRGSIVAMTRSACRHDRADVA